MSGERGPLSMGATARRLRGSSDRRSESSDRKAVPVEVPPRPSFLTGEARKEWTRVTRELKRAGRIAKTDRGVLAAYCLAWARLLEVEALLEVEGYTAAGSKGQDVVSPTYTVWSDLVRRVESLSRALGLNVAARARLPEPPPTPSPPDPMDELRRRREPAGERPPYFSSEHR